MKDMNSDDLNKTHKCCFVCKTYKFRSDFCNAKASKDGLNPTCKECCNERYKNKAALLRSDNDRYKAHLEKIHARNLRRKEAGYVQKYNPLSNKKQNVEYPEKIKARLIANKAYKSGLLLKKPCEVCDNENSVPHHEDYSQPLAVIWLCRKHHMEIHRTFNNIIEQIRNRNL